MRARPAVAERVGARNGTGGAVLREIMRLDTHFWARRVWVDFRKVSCYAIFAFQSRKGASSDFFFVRRKKGELNFLVGKRC